MSSRNASDILQGGNKKNSQPYVYNQRLRAGENKNFLFYFLELRSVHMQFTFQPPLSLHLSLSNLRDGKWSSSGYDSVQC